MNFFLFCLGCKVNSYENDLLRQELLDSGNIEVFSPEEADLIIINTCSVTSTADQKSRQHIRRFRRACPHGVLAVMGCYSQKNYDQAAEIGGDIVIGTSFRSELLGMVSQFLKDHQKIVKVETSNRKEKYEEFGQFALADNTRAYLKIQDGCDNFCSYCLIPFVRGNSRSRAKENVLKEAKILVEKGYKEIVITGIEIGFYGMDLGDGSYRLGDLLRDILEENPSLFRLRVSSLNASEVDDSFLSVIRDFPAFASHLHLSLQSGSNAVLKRMKRPYTKEEYFSTLSQIRSIRPDIAITTDIIAGFVGESEEEWEETMEFARRCCFAEIHVFPYSPRQGTYAANLKDTPPEIKKRRTSELLALSKKLRQEYERACYGKEFSVLFEDYDQEKHISYGHTSNFLLVKENSCEPMKGMVKNVLYSPENAAD